MKSFGWMQKDGTESRRIQKQEQEKHVKEQCKMQTPTVLFGQHDSIEKTQDIGKVNSTNLYETNAL